MKTYSNVSKTVTQESRSKLLSDKCKHSQISSMDIVNNVPSTIIRSYPWLNAALFPIRSKSLMYCAIPKIASKTLISLMIYVYLRDIIQQIDNNQTNIPVDKLINIPMLVDQLTKNGISISNPRDSNSIRSSLEAYLHLLRYESVNSTSHSLYLNPWRLSLEKIFPDIYFKSLTNVSQLFSSSFTRALFVRHPFERLASAYKERIATLTKDRVEAEPHYDSVRKSICRRYTLTDKSKFSFIGRNTCEHIIPSFEHFVQYILSTAELRDGVNRMDGHWKPYSVVCQVCQFKYNFIGKYETFNDDFNLFLKSVNVSDWNIQKRRGASGHSTWQYRQLYSSLSDDLICKLKKLYNDDFQFFNYRVEDYIKRTTLTCP